MDPLRGCVKSKVKDPFLVSQLAWKCQVHTLEYGKGRVNDCPFKGHDLEVAPILLANGQSHDYL